MYECPICLTVNHDSRLHCSFCGTIPAKYSVFNRPTKSPWSGFGIAMVEVVAAKGCSRQCQHHASRVYLRTMPLDYYAS